MSARGWGVPRNREEAPGVEGMEGGKQGEVSDGSDLGQWRGGGLD